MKTLFERVSEAMGRQPEPMPQGGSDDQRLPHAEECGCENCRALDRQFPGQGRQLRFPWEPGK